MAEFYHHSPVCSPHSAASPHPKASQPTASKAFFAPKLLPRVPYPTLHSQPPPAGAFLHNKRSTP